MSRVGISSNSHLVKAQINPTTVNTSPKFFLSDNDNGIAKCTQCKNYLSVAPIVIIRAGIIVCGRCLKDQTISESNRACFYENLAKLMYFPCKNDVFGCSVKIPWGKVLDHEVSCIYERMTCPAINCEAKVVNDEIMAHFESNHKHLIEDSQCHIPQDIDSSINKLFIWKHQLFIIQIKNDGGDIFFRVSSMKGDAKKILIYIKSKSSSNSICLNKFAVTKYDSKLPTFSDKEKININALKNVLESEITCKLSFDKGAKLLQNTNDSNLFSEMECPVCTAYMRPPIYMCSAGHSLCGQCKPKLQSCPSCTSAFSKSRNYSLEKIAQIVKYPCKNKDQGCDFVTNLDQITLHESKCSVSYFDSEVNCLISNSSRCSWRGSYAKAFQHIYSTHSDLCINLGSFWTINMSFSHENQWFLQYDRRIFLLDIKYSNILYANSYAYSAYSTNSGCSKDEVKWAVLCISEEKVLDQYIFFLEIIKGQRFLSVNGNCEKVVPSNLNPSHFISISKSLLNDFIVQNQITFKLNISNQNRM